MVWANAAPVKVNEVELPSAWRKACNNSTFSGVNQISGSWKLLAQTLRCL